MTGVSRLSGLTSQQLYVPVHSFPTSAWRHAFLGNSRAGTFLRELGNKASNVGVQKKVHQTALGSAHDGLVLLDHVQPAVHCPCAYLWEQVPRSTGEGEYGVEGEKDGEEATLFNSKHRHNGFMLLSFL